MTRYPGFFHRLARLAPLGLLAFASAAQAWTLVREAAPVTVIHQTGLYQAQPGQRLAVNDMVETPDQGGAQLQDESGRVVALGPDTRVLFAPDAHLSLLRGWLKLADGCAAADCAAPVVDTEGTRFTALDHAALVIAAAPAGYPGADDADAVFVESGSARLLALGAAARGKPAQAKLATHQFAVHARAAAAITSVPSPAPAFVGAMPVAFRDALRALPPAAVPPAPPASHAAPANAAHPAAYAELADWLVSALPARNAPDTRFAERFRARLADPAFRRDLKQHIRELPDWHDLVFPPPPRRPAVAARNPVPDPPSAYPSIYVRP
ncbi:hypothetical protein [Burkholderia gladioli]|uniref:hypothetical protein n=1 Tax=Burkholderia gladioli TaxID=28095 RepID=UPI001640FD28|nr:hypothetical protein [Burkholderia gladioli]